MMKCIAVIEDYFQEFFGHILNILLTTFVTISKKRCFEENVFFSHDFSTTGKNRFSHISQITLEIFITFS